jgi:biotin operon repressor
MPRKSLARALARLGSAFDAAVTAVEEAGAILQREAARGGKVLFAGRWAGPLGEDAADAVHDALKRAKRPLTSKELSTQTGVARTSVARHVRALQKTGVAIVSAPRRGYELAKKGTALERIVKGRRGGDGARGRFAQEIILLTLKDAKGPVLGDDLATKSGVSKMTITRMIVALRKKGHKIVGRRGVGYSLA